MKLKKYVGDKAFYSMVLGVMLPIAVQNAVSTFVSLLDNIMVGRLGTESMSGVSIVNQFLFVFNLAIFGAVGAAGIFMAQYHGQNNREGKRDTFRFKMLSCILVGLLGIAVLYFMQKPLIELFLTGDAGEGDPLLTLAEGEKYLRIMLIGLLPFSIANAYASSMRETGDTVTPMVASLAAVGTNFLFNYVLIFGKLGFPRLGVEGAAIATVISRFVEMLWLLLRTHLQSDRYSYIKGAYRSLRLPRGLAKQIAIRGLPLIANELLWALAITFCNQYYSTRGLEVVAAQNIYTTLWNVMSVVYLSMGSAISIVVGNLLGADRLEEAKDTDRKMTVFSVFCGVLAGLMMVAIAWIFPRIYNTGAGVRALATDMILISALMMPISAYTNAAYFTIRSGGQVFITMLFDSVFMWLVMVPLVFALSEWTAIPIRPLFAIGQGTEILKALLGYLMIRRGTWVHRVVPEL